MKNKNDIFLIVDDEPDMCWALENILKKNEFSAKKAFNGQEALALVKQDRFRLIFLDAKLPDIEGLVLARQIKEIDPSVPIVIISGYFYRDDVDILNAQRERLVFSFIAKPFLHDEVIKTIENTSAFQQNDP